MNTLGQRIADYRKAVNLTQAGLAEACSVTAQTARKSVSLFDGNRKEAFLRGARGVPARRVLCSRQICIQNIVFKK